MGILVGDGFYSFSALCVPIGFLLSRLVPMQAGVETRAVTYSLEHIYLVLIWLSV